MNGTAACTPLAIPVTIRVYVSAVRFSETEKVMLMDPLISDLVE